MVKKHHSRHINKVRVPLALIIDGNRLVYIFDTEQGEQV